ncbi:MAG: Mur ligase family protein, partial [candidate division Zixibacteria bacterium]|nr:Mur ligase family protein [candidate division Zixibacteria bacterium]
MRKHTYVSAERFIISREFFGLKLGLRNISEFLQSIGAPQTAYRTIHVAGTNGKGSTAAMLAAILQAQGYKTGLFTSPHLVSLRERISVNGRKISKRSVVSFIDANRPELARRKLSFFELLAAMAFDHFRRARVDVAVIETGLGGRLDATNVLRPELTLTTEISRDHMEILGRSLIKIAREKAGIIKPAIPHLVGLLPEEAEEVIRHTCYEKQAPFFRLSARDMRLYPEEMKFDFRYNGARWAGVRTSLKGIHQMRNAALALKASAILAKNGLPLTRRAQREGLARTDWPGRFQ